MQGTHKQTLDFSLLRRAGEHDRRQGAGRGVIVMPGPDGEFRVIVGEDFQRSWMHGLQRQLPFDDVQ